jgi:hypothetical protein
LLGQVVSGFNFGIVIGETTKGIFSMGPKACFMAQPTTAWLLVTTALMKSLHLLNFYLNVP